MLMLGTQLKQNDLALYRYPAAPRSELYTRFMVLTRRVAALTVLLAAACWSLEREPLNAYRERRQALAQRHADGVVLLFSFAEREGQVTRSPFRQENNFYYLSGWNEPGAVMCLLGEGQAGPYREVLFVPGRNASHEAWMGRRLAPGDPQAGETSGFGEVRDLKELPELVTAALQARPRLYTLMRRDPPGYEQPPEPDRSVRLEQLAPRYPKVDIRESVDSMRGIKSENELRLIRKAAAASVAAHRAAWERIKPGVYEYQVAATMLGVMMDLGCLRPAYTPIIGSGENSTVLHYSQATRRMRSGDLVVIDVGGEYGHYAADITRTVPADGRFTPRQREIYEIVLGAQKAALQAVRPGMILSGHGDKSLSQIVRTQFDAHGSDRDGRSLGRYFIHGLGHHVGLEVHDPGDASEPLRPGMVVTIEPGLYLPQEDLGVRIEDMVLITADGAEVLSKDLPKDPDEIERLMQSEPHASEGVKKSGTVSRAP
jgi:Xaa-Pro aminopeptidase